MNLSTQYAHAMRDGDHARCIRIEEQAGLYGLPPELVSQGLAQLDAGARPAGIVQATEQVVNPDREQKIASDMIHKFGSCPKFPACACKINHGFDCIPF